MSFDGQILVDHIPKIPFDKFEKDFSFIVNGKIYKTNSYVANILSPNVSKMFDEKLNVSYYEINLNCKGNFNRIIEYGEMKPISIRKDESQYFRSIMKLLGNNEEVIRFSKEIEGSITYENVVQRIEVKKSLDLDFNEEIAFISSNFHNFHMKFPNEISKLDIHTIEQIITNEKLKLLNEEELFNVILELYQQSKEYSTLFSFVIFMNLPTKSIQEFNIHFDINDINQFIWEKIRSRLEQDISNESIETYKKLHQELLNHRYFIKKYKNNMIQYLSEQCHGNVHNQNIVHITTSSIINEKYNVENIVEQNDDNFFATQNENDPWIQFDFKERYILLESYTLKTNDVSEYCDHLKNWVLEVSNDDQNYTEIDRHEICSVLNGRLKRGTFKVSCPTPQRYVRLKQIGPNWGGNNQLVLNQIEFSGFLFE